MWIKLKSVWFIALMAVLFLPASTLMHSESLSASWGIGS